MELILLFALAMTRPWLRGGQRGDAPGQPTAAETFRYLDENGTDVFISEAGDTFIQE